MIGFFDSGLGGLAILKEVKKALPEYSYLYLGDNARTPYGSRSQDIIYKFVRDGVDELFKRGSELVILACNTASSSALRRIQQKFLPENYPDKRVLGVIVPTAEEIVKISKSKHVGIIATEATVESFAFPREITKASSDFSVHQISAPLLVPIIESGEIKWRGLNLAVKKYAKELLNRSKEIDTVVLGCTHYALIEDVFRSHIPKKINLITQNKIVANKLIYYLNRHPEIERKLIRGDEIKFMTTEDSWRIRTLFNLFYGDKVEPEKIEI